MSVDKIQIIEGRIPILISVPHAVKHIRGNKEKLGELNTDIIGHNVQNYTHCHLFLNTGVTGGPNYDEVNVYKGVLADYVIQNNIKYVIDIHGAADQWEFDFELGTAMNRNVKAYEDTVDILLDLSKENGYSTTVDTYFPACGANRITTYIHRLTGVPSLQIEINYKRRMDEISIHSTSLFISEFVKKLESVL